MQKMIAMLLGAALPLVSQAADMHAGQETAVTCSACHGANGVSITDEIPNLAGQKTAYLTKQLQAFRDGTRKNPLMNAIAGQLSDIEIENVTAHFSSLGSMGGTEISSLGETLAVTEIEFPSDYKESFTLYSKVNQEAKKRVRHNLGNAAALKGVDANGRLADHTFVMTEIYTAKLDAAGKPETGDDGFYVADKLLALAAMEKRPGWGDKVPELLRNGDWAYAVFTPAHKLRDGLNQAACLACHKPLHEADYLFSYEDLAKR